MEGKDTIEAWDLLREAGPGACSTPAEIRAVLEPLRRPLNHRDVAGCLSLFMRTWIDSAGIRAGLTNLSLNGPSGSAPSLLASQWKVDAFVDSIPKSVNWDFVIRSLDDFPDLRIESQDAFSSALVHAYKRARRQAFIPGALFLGADWKHSGVQATLLLHALNSEEVRFEPTVEGGRDTKWSCVSLVETLLRLAERGHHGVCHAAFQIGRATDPDSLLLSLLWSKPAYEQLREELYAALVPALLERALRDDVEAIRVLGIVWSLNKELVIRGMLDVLTRDAEVLNLVIRLPDALAMLSRLPLRVFLAAICAAAGRDPSFQLETLLRERLGAISSQDLLAASIREVLRFVESRQQGPDSRAAPRLPPNCLNAIFSALQASKPPEMATEIGQAAELYREGEPDKIEAQANATFQLIYSEQMDIEQVISMLSRFKDSDNPQEQAVFQCMIHNLFDEYRFFQNYPPRELRITGILFGNLIQHQLLSSWTLSMAINYVIKALRQAPTTEPDAKMFRFGVLALEQFTSRLPDMPHVTADILAIPHFAEAEPVLFAEVERAKTLAASPSVPPASPATQAAATLGAIGISLPPSSGVDGAWASVGADGNAGAQGTSWPTALRGSESPEAYTALCNKLDSIIGGPTSEEAPPSPGTQFEDQIQFLINNLTMANLEEKVGQARQVIVEENFAWTAYYMVVGRISTQANFHGLYLQFIDALNEKKLLVELRQRTLVQVRKLLKSNRIVTSTTERSVLKNLGSWLGQLTLAKNKPLLQREVDLKELLLDGYERGWMIAVVPFAAKILEKAQNSRVFTSSNPWMAGILGVLAEIYHLPDVKLHLKFETEVLCRCLSIDLQSITPTNLLQSRIKPRLVSNPDFNSNSAAATPTASVATPSSSLPPSAVLSTAFGPPQGQQGGHIGAGGSQALNLHIPQLPFTQQTPGTSMGVPFQQQFGPSLYGNEEPQRSKHQRAPGPQVAATAPQQSQIGLPGMGGLPVSQEVTPIPTETVIPNLGNYVFVNGQLALFARHPDLKRVVPVAVDRAIREIIQPAVERSVSIATITTKELILKDFAMEPDETRMLNAAHLMITNLAGSLALVTCKEHLRLSMASHLRTLLTNQGLSQEDMPLVEQVVQTCSSENLELGCLLIEKAATDKAVRDIDEALESACAVRREHRERGQVYYDTSIFNNGMRFPNSLPQQLRPRPLEGGLAGEQLAVYEAFLRAPRPPIAAPSSSAPPMASVADVPPSMASGLPVASTSMTAPTNRMLTMQQALEKYKTVVSALDIAVTQLLQQPGFHDLPASSLPADHDIIHKLHFLRSIIAATAPESRFDVALIVAQSVFRRLFESSPTERLRLSVQVGVLDAVSSALGGVGLRKKITDWVIGSIAKGNLNAPVTAALVDANLVRGVELDNLIADLFEGQLSNVTCAFALELVQHCVVQSRSWPVVEASRTLNFLSNIGIGSSSLATPPGLPRLLEEVADVAVQQSSGVSQFRGQPGQSPSLVPPGVEMLNGQSTAVVPTSAHAPPPFAFTRNPAIDPQAWKDVELALQRWIVVSRDGGSAAQFLAGLKDKGLLRGDQNIERFFYLCTELCVESFLTIVAQHTPSEPANQANAQADEIAKSRLAYTGVDSYGVLVSLLVKLADHRVRPTLAAQALEAVAKVMAYDVTTRFSSGHEAGFDQRPYFRMILNFQRELLSIPSSGSVLANAPAGTNEVELNESADKLLAVFAEAHHHYFSPEHAPGFCFAWLELISHHSFMPRLLKEERGWSVLHRLLIDLFTFMEPYLKSVQLTPAVRILYKGTLRVLLVLLHDFPEFLCFFHFSLCNVIPPTCVQLRNLILSAFPRTMRLPDPFTPNLKVDLLPEITVHPRILADYTAVLDQAQGNLRADVDLYLRTRNQPARFLSTLCDRLRASGNWHALNALVLHVGVSAITYSKIADTDGQDPSASSYLLGAKDIFQTLASDLDAEGRYQFLNAIANHLRYPNSHTHYFSCVILGLFKEGSELVQEQVTRVLLERLIVHRPHPWGLLVTFIELMKNPRYSFWDHSFTRCTPEIHKVFESVASSCGAGQTVAMS